MPAGLTVTDTRFSVRETHGTGSAQSSSARLGSKRSAVNAMIEDGDWLRPMQQAASDSRQQSMRRSRKPARSS